MIQEVEALTSIIPLTDSLTQQAPSLVIFSTVVGLIVRHFLAHLKGMSAEHTAAMVNVVQLTSDALAKNTEAIFEHSRMVGATIQSLNHKP